MNCGLIERTYKLLSKSLGPSNWWPGETPYEIMVGAILTQNTSWKNVEKAIQSLKKESLLEPEAMHQCNNDKLAQLIRSSGYYNQKAIKLKHLLDWFINYEYQIKNIIKKWKNDTKGLRNEILKIHGIGPETADSILCYALELPFFVIDAYTMRLISRLTQDELNFKYESLRNEVEECFTRTYEEEDLILHFNEFHALIVRHGNTICKKRNPDCKNCPLNTFCKSNNILSD